MKGSLCCGSNSLDSSRPGKGERILEPLIRFQHGLALLKGKSLSFALRGSDGRSDQALSARKAMLNVAPCALLKRFWQITPQQLVAGADEGLGTAGVTLPRAAPKE